MEEVLQRYLADELGERKKIHEEEMKELSKSVYFSPLVTSWLDNRAKCPTNSLRLSQPEPRSAHLRVHHGLPHHPLPPACVRAALPPHDPTLHGDGHQAVRHVHRRRPQRLRRLRLHAAGQCQRPTLLVGLLSGSVATSNVTVSQNNGYCDQNITVISIITILCKCAQTATK